MQVGQWVTAEDARGTHVASFMRKLDQFQEQALPFRGTLDGTQPAVMAIRNVLGGSNH